MYIIKWVFCITKCIQLIGIDTACAIAVSTPRGTESRGHPPHQLNPPYFGASFDGSSVPWSRCIRSRRSSMSPRERRSSSSSTLLLVALLLRANRGVERSSSPSPTCRSCRQAIPRAWASPNPHNDPHPILTVLTIGPTMQGGELSDMVCATISFTADGKEAWITDPGNRRLVKTDEKGEEILDHVMFLTVQVSNPHPILT